MSVLILMIPFSLLLGAGFVASFLWATRHGQFDDVQTPSLRILFDDENDNERKKRNEHR
jgi:cbb3-type cytochrome oxidase maturation protein